MSTKSDLKSHKGEKMISFADRLKFLRKEQKFESFDHLKEQLKLDKKTCEEKDY